MTEQVYSSESIRLVGLPPTYSIVRPLTSGSMGTVYLASGPSGFCVIKEFRGALYEQGKKECQLHKSLPQHEGLVGYIEHFDSEKAIYMVVEYAPEGDFFDYLSRYWPVTKEYAWKTFSKIVCAVRELHRCGVAHHDLKLENIMCNNGQPKVADFGLSARYDDVNALVQSPCCGSFLFAAPEMITAPPETRVRLRWSTDRNRIGSMGCYLGVTLGGNIVTCAGSEEYLTEMLIQKGPGGAIYFAVAHTPKWHIRVDSAGKVSARGLREPCAQFVPQMQNGLFVLRSMASGESRLHLGVADGRLVAVSEQQATEWTVEPIPTTYREYTASDLFAEDHLVIPRALDVWSLGLVLFLMLSGLRNPWAGEDCVHVGNNIRTGNISLPPNMSLMEKAVIWGFLNVDPQKRLDYFDNVYCKLFLNGDIPPTTVNI